jgi:hypothetical protein
MDHHQPKLPGDGKPPKDPEEKILHPKKPQKRRRTRRSSTKSGQFSAASQPDRQIPPSDEFWAWPRPKQNKEKKPAEEQAEITPPAKKSTGPDQLAGTQLLTDRPEVIYLNDQPTQELSLEESSSMVVVPLGSSSEYEVLLHNYPATADNTEIKPDVQVPITNNTSGQTVVKPSEQLPETTNIKVDLSPDLPKNSLGTVQLPPNNNDDIAFNPTLISPADYRLSVPETPVAIPSNASSETRSPSQQAHWWQRLYWSQPLKKYSANSNAGPVAQSLPSAMRNTPAIIDQLAASKPVKSITQRLTNLQPQLAGANDPTIGSMSHLIKSAPYYPENYRKITEYSQADRTSTDIDNPPATDKAETASHFEPTDWSNKSWGEIVALETEKLRIGSLRRPENRPAVTEIITSYNETGTDQPPELPLDRLVQNSVWQRIGVDVSTGEAVEMPTLAYSEAFGQEQRQGRQLFGDQPPVSPPPDLNASAQTNPLSPTAPVSPSTEGAEPANQPLPSRVESTIRVGRNTGFNSTDLWLWIVLIIVILALAIAINV